MITIKEAVDYEIQTSWWVPHCDSRLMQNFAGWYYAKKVRRRMQRWVGARELRHQVRKEFNS